MTTAVLSNASKADRRELLGMRLMTAIAVHEPKFAAKITGMLLEKDDGYLLQLLADYKMLIDAVSEALALLRQHWRLTHKPSSTGVAQSVPISNYISNPTTDVLSALSSDLLSDDNNNNNLNTDVLSAPSLSLVPSDSNINHISDAQPSVLPLVAAVAEPEPEPVPASEEKDDDEDEVYGSFNMTLVRLPLHTRAGREEEHWDFSFSRLSIFKQFKNAKFSYHKILSSDPLPN
ncbi:MAG: hypothetical protein GY826_30945 [Fuerstiella sp.]|nr:hypothetical protein [Fuerstiella sp.]